MSEIKRLRLCYLLLAMVLSNSVARGADADATMLRLGGCGGVFFYALSGEFWVEVDKQDLNKGGRKTHLHALLFGPDRSALDEVWMDDDGQDTKSGPGPVQRAVLRTHVQRPGVYGVMVTVTQDRNGEHVSWGFQSNCRRYLVETSRGHRDARHEEPLVLRDAGREGDIGFMPGTQPLSIEVSDLTTNVTELPIYDGVGSKIKTLAVSSGRIARHDFPADPSREKVLWRMHLHDAQAVVRIDGVTRWDRRHRGGDLSMWTPDVSSWFGFHENRWLLTPYRRTIYAEAGDEGTLKFDVHNNSPKPKRVKLSVEFDGDAEWPVDCPREDIKLAAYSSVPVLLTYEVPSAGSSWACYVRATVLDETKFSTWSSVTLHRGTAPAESPVALPIKLEPFRHENEQFGYSPEYPLDNQVYFDLDNRPFVLAQDGIFSLRREGWVKTTTACRGDTNVTFPIRAFGSKITFDQDNHVYFLGRIGGSTGLFHSRDHGVTFTAWPIPGSGVFDLEQFSGHNQMDGPPPLARFHLTAKDPKRIWRRINDLDLILPSMNEDGSIVMGEPIPVSKKCIGLSAHSGIPSTIVSRGDKVHMTWGEATQPEDEAPGVPTFVATYNRTVRKLETPVLIGYGPPANDIHNSPCITMDSKGILHVLIGTHGRTFKYVRSASPDQAGAEWTEAEDIGPGLRQTYVGMVCDPHDTLHLVFRLWRDDTRYFPAGVYANLAYMRKLPGAKWSEAHPLVVAAIPDYSIFYHRLTLDRAGTLFLSYDYWSTYWFYRTDHRGARRSLLMSQDGGNAWQLVPSALFTGRR